MSDDVLIQTSEARRRFLEVEGERLARLAQEGQSPYALWIGCCDSRVTAEALVGARPGELFVVRVIANVVPPPGALEPNPVEAAIDFAVDRLKVGHIIVCGHTDCGGLRALEAPPARDAAHASVAAWMAYAAPALSQVESQGLDGEARHQALVESNVLLQLQHLGQYSVVAAACNERRLALHGWVFDLEHRCMRFYDDQRQRFVRFEE